MTIRSMKDLFNEPRLDAEGREERYQAIIGDKAKTLWDKLSDEQYAQDFITSYIPYPELDLLANMIARLAELKHKQNEVSNTTLNIEQKQRENYKLALRLIDDLEEHVLRVAEMRAEQIFYPEGD